MARVTELMLVSLLLVLAGVAIGAEEIPVEQRVGALASIIALLLGLARLGRRR
jgi:uncharacterized Tic20 family protein